MTVAEAKTGNIPQAGGTQHPSVPGKIPGEGKQVSSEETKMYTQKEVDALVHGAKSQAGRATQEIEVERDTLKSQVLRNERDLEEIQSERESLHKEIEELTSDDPKKFDVVKKDRELRERERIIRADAQELEKQKALHEGTVREAQQTMREIMLWEIALEYTEGDPVKLKALCDSSGATSEEKIREIPVILGWSLKAGKNPTTPKSATQPLKPYSGYTEGGKRDLSRLTPRQKMVEGLKEGSPIITQSNT